MLTLKVTVDLFHFRVGQNSTPPHKKKKKTTHHGEVKMVNMYLKKKNKLIKVEVVNCLTITHL